MRCVFCDRSTTYKLVIEILEWRIVLIVRCVFCGCIYHSNLIYDIILCLISGVLKVELGLRICSEIWSKGGPNLMFKC